MNQLDAGTGWKFFDLAPHLLADQAVIDDSWKPPIGQPPATQTPVSRDAAPSVDGRLAHLADEMSAIGLIGAV